MSHHTYERQLPFRRVEEVFDFAAYHHQGLAEAAKKGFSSAATPIRAFGPSPDAGGSAGAAAEAGAVFGEKRTFSTDGGVFAPHQRFRISHPLPDPQGKMFSVL